MSVFVFRTHEIQLIINNIAADHIRPILGRGCVKLILRYTHSTRSGSCLCGIRFALYIFDPFRVGHAWDSSVLDLEEVTCV
ncbi:MAG: hypothetical protein WDA08_02995 [Weeksellaceae bacterium]